MCSMLPQGKGKQCTTGKRPSMQCQSTHLRRTMTDQTHLKLFHQLSPPQISSVPQHRGETIMLTEACTFARLGRPRPPKRRLALQHRETAASERPRASSKPRTHPLGPKMLARTRNDCPVGTVSELRAHRVTLPQCSAFAVAPKQWPLHCDRACRRCSLHQSSPLD